MIALWIVLALLSLLLIIILFGTVKIRIVYRDKVRLKVGLWIPFFTVISDKPKKEKEPKKLETCKNPEKVLQRELKRQEKEAARAARKKARQAEKKRKKALKKADQKKKKKLKREQQAQSGKTPPKPNVIENLEMILTILKKLYGATRGKFKLRLRRMYIAVGTGDAAKTAMLYGVIVQSASYLLNFLNAYLIPMKKNNGEVNVYPDYTASKTTVDVDIVCSFKIRSLIAIGGSVALSFLTARSNALKKAALREQRKAEKAKNKKL